MDGIDHSWLNIHAGKNGVESVMALRSWGLPQELASNIVERAYWLQSDKICKKYCCGSDCCHVIGYDDVFG
jgi:hypothetical protein